MIFLSSALVPLAAMPGWMGFLAQFNPMTWAIDAVRPLILQGWAEALPHVGMVIAMVLFDALCSHGGARFPAGDRVNGIAQRSPSMFVNESQIRALIRLLGDEDERIVKTISGKLIDFGDSAVPLLQEAEIEQPEMADRIVTVLEEIRGTRLKKNSGISSPFRKITSILKRGRSCWRGMPIRRLTSRAISDNWIVWLRMCGSRRVPGLRGRDCQRAQSLPVHRSGGLEETPRTTMRSRTVISTV